MDPRIDLDRSADEVIRDSIGAPSSIGSANDRDGARREQRQTRIEHSIRWEHIAHPLPSQSADHGKKRGQHYRGQGGREEIY